MSQEEGEDRRAIPLLPKWGDITDVPTHYANQLYISHAMGEFYLVFGEAQPPIILPPGNVPDHLDIVPIAKIVLTPQAMMRCADAITTNVKSYLKTQEDGEE